jgi:hypothetical protein
MKKLFLVFSVAVSSFAFSQAETPIDYSKFNYSLLERMIIDEINDYRVTIGLKELYTSKVLKDSYSSVTASINAKQDKSFHTTFNHYDNIVTEKLYNELYKSTNGECGNEMPFNLFIKQSGEIIAIASSEYSTTYEDLATSIVQAWLDSPGHKKIIETKFEHASGHPGQISCCVKKSTSDIFYFAVGFVLLEYISN